MLVTRVPRRAPTAKDELLVLVHGAYRHPQRNWQAVERHSGGRAHAVRPLRQPRVYARPSDALRRPDRQCADAGCRRSPPARLTSSPAQRQPGGRDAGGCARRPRRGRAAVRRRPTRGSSKITATRRDRPRAAPAWNEPDRHGQPPQRAARCWHRAAGAYLSICLKWSLALAGSPSFPSWWTSSPGWRGAWARPEELPALAAIPDSPAGALAARGETASPRRPAGDGGSGEDSVSPG